MNAVLAGAKTWWRDVASGWNRFWFRPSAPHTLCLIRILTGWSLFYSLTVYAFHLTEFLGPDGWLPGAFARSQSLPELAWSYLWLTDSPAVLWALHIAAMIAVAMYTVGLFSRTTSVLAFLIAVSYAYRLNMATFGFDQIVTMLSMYVMLGPCGRVYSVDCWLRRRRDKSLPPAQPSAAQPSVAANLAIRLLQVHMCVMYLFSGLTKMRGFAWWDGSAVWMAVANSEYRTLDLTWMAHYPALVSALTHVTVLWETFYIALVWPRVTRPIVLALAVGVHGGIAIALGMITFGCAMLIGNLAFVRPETVRGLFEWLRARWPSRVTS